MGADNQSLYLPVVLATAREGRRSEKAAKYVLSECQKAGFKTDLIDVRDFRISATNNTGKIPQSQKLAQYAKKADGFIVVTPEYNHGYPGELKMMLDMLYQDYFKKPVGFCGVSIGPLGGGRAVEQLRLVSIEFHMVPIREAIYFPFVENLFDERGEIKDDSYAKRLNAFFEELSWYASALKKARES